MADIAKHLAHNYGDKAVLIAELARKGYGRRIVEELPFLEAEVVYSVNEYQLSISLWFFPLSYQDMLKLLLM